MDYEVTLPQAIRALEDLQAEATGNGMRSLDSGAVSPEYVIAIVGKVLPLLLQIQEEAEARGLDVHPAIWAGIGMIVGMAVGVFINGSL